MTLQNSSKYINTMSILAIALLHNIDASASPINANEINTVTSINFSVDSNHLDQLKIPLTALQLSERVISNLSEWHYPLKQAAPNASHALVASLGDISHESTPVGFSFTRGNSDPRSAEFQKADVLPITCTLTTKDSSQSPITHKMTFSTEAFFSGYSTAHIADKLVDQITTTCFTLLEGLKHPLIDKTEQTTTFKPTWMPSIQVVVKPVTQTVAKPIKAESTSKIIPASSDISLTNTETTEDSTTEVDKELIINNQGSPLTLHLGHERR